MIIESTKQFHKGVGLTRKEAKEVMTEILDRKWTPAQLGAWLSALTAKGETKEELLGFILGLRSRMVTAEWNGPAIDTCGTGGDHSGSFNISTTAAIIACAAGATVTKGGNRSASSACGSADILESIGIKIELEPNEVCTWLKESKFAFLFSQKYHPELRNLADIRKELGFRSVFNLLGPLCNPIRPSGQVIGVASKNLVPLFAQTLLELDVKHAMVFHGKDGLDELSLGAPTEVFLIKDGNLSQFTVNPASLGLLKAPKEALKGGSPGENARILGEIACGGKRIYRDACVLNAAFALMVFGIAKTMEEGVALANEALDIGAVLNKLEELIERSKFKAGGV